MADLGTDKIQTLSLFDPVPDELEEEQDPVDQVVDQLRQRFGSAAIVRSHSLEHGARAIERAGLVGGHNGGNTYE